MKGCDSGATTIAAARRAARSALAAAGIDEPDADARALLSLATGLDGAALLARADAPLDADATARLAALLARRLAREPVARIRGAREFWGLPFSLSAATLVPRPDTETLVEAVLAARPDRGAAIRIADLGTGSGALLAALLHEYPAAIGVGTDCSRAALVTAGANLARLGLLPRAALVCGDWGAALAGGIDILVTNPPYIRTADLATLAPDVRAHEPIAALDGGADGLDAYRAIAADLPRLLAPGGLMVLEVGDGQANAVAALLAATGLATLGTRRDLAGRQRAVVAERTGKDHRERNRPPPTNPLGSAEKSD